MNSAVFVDSSGSMAELGKRFILKDLLKYLLRGTHAQSSSAPGQLFLWAAEISPVVPIPFNENPRLHLEGTNDLKTVKAFLETTSDPSWASIALFTDGLFRPKEIRDFSTFCRTKGIFVVCVGVGADADLSALRRLSSEDCVYEPPDIFSALERLRHGPAKPFQAPFHFDEIQFSSQEPEPFTQDDWDSEEDWDA